MTADRESLCECGHPHGAHQWRESTRKAPSGRYFKEYACKATVSRRHEHGDDSWPCPCSDFKDKK